MNAVCLSIQLVVYTKVSLKVGFHVLPYFSKVLVYYSLGILIDYEDVDFESSDVYLEGSLELKVKCELSVIGFRYANIGSQFHPTPIVVRLVFKIHIPCDPFMKIVD